MDLTKTGRFKRQNADRRVTNKRLSDPGMMMRRHTGVAERLRVRARELRVPMGSVSGAARAVASSLPIAKIVIVFSLVLFAAIGILIGVKAYTESRQMHVRIEYGRIKMNVVTMARTVRELLEQNNVRLGPEDEVTPAPNTRLTDDMVVLVNRAIIVFIKSNGKMGQLYVTGGSVEAALAKAKISYDQDDEISPSIETVLSAGMIIRHVAVESSIVLERKSLQFKTRYQNTATLLKGKTQVEKSGKQGERTKTIEIIYKDGKEVSRKVIADTTTSEPIDRIILKGTGSAPKPPTGSSGSSSGSGSGSGSSSTDGSNNYGGHYSHVREEDLVIPPIPSSFKEILYMQITAYTHTGRTTSRGNWPQYTRTLSKPGSIAVDPKAIPYGTLLYVTGYGYCVAEDTGANDVDSSRMGDVFMNTRAECYKWGRRKNVTVYVVQEKYLGKRP